MEFATLIGELEIRASGGGSRRLRGTFPYNSLATVHSGRGRAGERPKKEQFKPRAFAYRVNAPDKEIHLLAGHSYDKALASKLTNTLHLTDTDQALKFEAEITPEIADTSYGTDVLAQIDSGLAYGISPGFLLPPARRVAKPEEFSDEGHDPSRGMFNALIRTINSALLYELSIVTRPVYKASTIEADKAQPEMTDAEKIAAGWTYNDKGALVPPPKPDNGIVTRAMPAPLRWR